MVLAALDRHAAKRRLAMTGYDFRALASRPYNRPMITSRLTSKAQTTIPQAVRIALGLRPGDELAYVIQDGRAVLTRFDGHAVADDQIATFSEWSSAADCKAYDKL